METVAESTGSNSIIITEVKKENAELLKDYILEKAKKY